jgi:hypothetical protein
MASGTKVKDDTKSGGNYISYPKDGDNVYRFLDEPDDWTKYFEHFDEALRMSFPCPDERTYQERKNMEGPSTCPRCEEKRLADLEAQREGKDGSNIWGPQKRYLVNVLTSEGYVNLVKLPASVLDDLLLYNSRYGTLRDREYTITKFKNRDNKVKYSVDRGDADKVNLDQYADRMQDHEEALQRNFNEWQQAVAVGHRPGETPLTDEVKEAFKGQAEQKFDDPQEKRENSWGDAPKAAAEPVQDQFPSEPAGAAEPEQADDEAEREISESELRAMSPEELKGLIESCGLEAPDSNESDELADFLISKLS